jgi:hypothetical protein
MVLLVVLLAQVVAPSEDRAPITPWGDITGFHRAWENLNSACRKLPLDSPEGEATCAQARLPRPSGHRPGRLGHPPENRQIAFWSHTIAFSTTSTATGCPPPASLMSAVAADEIMAEQPMIGAATMRFVAADGSS